MCDVLPANCAHFVCKIADTQLVCDLSALNRGPNPVHVIFSFFQHTPICKSRQFATVSTYPQIVDCPRLRCCPRSDSGVLVYCPRLTVITHTHIHTHTIPTHTHTHIHTHTIPTHTHTHTHIHTHTVQVKRNTSTNWPI